MTQILSDIQSGVRMLAKYPTLSIVAVLTFGLGIGLSTTVFCVVNGGLFKGLPFPEADRVVSVVATNVAQNQPMLPVSVHDFAVWQARQTTFVRMGAFRAAPINLPMEDGRPERFSACFLTVDAFEALGVQPVIGRGFREGDDRPGAAPVILLAYDLWRDRYGSSGAIIGKPIRVGGIEHTVIGVMPERYGFPIRESLWLPLTIGPVATARGQGPSYQIVARLRPGVSLATARAQAAAIASQLEQEFPHTNRAIGADVVPYARTVLNVEAHNLLYTMLGAGFGVLLIACVNVSNLLAARALLRRREVAVRMALGAGRYRVVRQHLTEVLVLASLGGALGVLMSVLGMQWFTRALTVNPPPFWITFGLDQRVMFFVITVIVVSSLVAGALPAIHAGGVSAGSALKDVSRSATSARLGRFSGTLVVGELALSCGLLIAAGLMVKSVTQLKNLSMPFAIDDILTARVDLPRSTYPDAATRIHFLERLLPRLQEIPGVEAATVSDGLPAAGKGLTAVEIGGQSYSQPADAPLAREAIVTAGYFETFRTALVSGREFTPQDSAASQPVAIVNESFARTAESWRTVVGVVPDLLMQGIGNRTSPVGYYIPVSQSDVAGSVRLAVRTRGEPRGIAALMRATVTSLDGDLAIYDVHAMRWVLDRQTWFYTVFGTFFTAFGICALLLAAAGLYGVVSFAVTQRTREMGVRSALGAQGTQLVLLVMRANLIQLVIGLSLGLAMALAASGALQPVLYRVDPRDGSVIAVVVATLALASLVATFLPARRVTKIDPVVVLGSE
jgi:putative ABC transport system permease protein